MINLKFYKIDNSHDHFLGLKNNHVDDLSFSIGEQNGVSIIYKNNYYIFTTAHNVSNNTKFYYKNHNLNIKYLNYDLDVCILESNEKDYNNYTLNLNFNNKDIFVNKLKLILDFKQIIEDNIVLLGPQVLLIECEKNINSDNLDFGMSGTPFFDNINNCVGLLSRKKDKLVHLIPIINFIRILENTSLCSFNELLDFKDNDLIIKKKSNKYYHTKNFKSKTFKKNDILIKVDNKNLNQGLIYNNILDINVSIYIYILYFKYDKNEISFNVIRNDYIKKINIFIKPYCKLQCIKNIPQIKYVETNNKIIYELNLNILNHFIKNNLKIEKKIPNNFLENINYCHKIFISQNKF